MKKHVALLLTILLFAALLGCGTDVSDSQPDITAPSINQPTIANTEASSDPGMTETEPDESDPFDLKNTFPIDLGFVTLRYPSKWQDSVQITGADAHRAEEAFEVSFSSGESWLFSICFNSEKGDLLGTLLGESYTTVSVTRAANLTDETLLLMQEDVNTILNALIAEYEFAPGERLTKEDTDVFEFDSKIGTLYYPSKWKNAVTIEQTDAYVRFSHNGNKLFDLSFEDDKGFLIGSVGSTTVNLVYYPSETAEERNMQDDVNVLLGYLMQRSDFLHSAPEDPVNADVFSVETKIGTLYYPAKWKDTVQIEATDEMVTFSNGRTKLFSLVFSEADGYFLGTYDDIPIYVVNYEAQGDENLAMQDDVNVIIQYLLEEEQFALLG